MLRTCLTFCYLLLSDGVNLLLGGDASRALRYVRMLRAGRSIKSSAEKPYEIKLYPGAKILLPTGTYVLVDESDMTQRYGSVELNLLLSGDFEYARFIAKLDPSFIWIWDKFDPFNFLQITITDSRDEEPITEHNIEDVRNSLRQFYETQENLQSYSLEAKQMNLAGWQQVSIVEEMQCRNDGRSSINYKISLQDRPFGLVLSATCAVDKIGKYRELVKEMADSYVRVPISKPVSSD